MNRPLKVLHVVGAMYPGGLENFLMNLYEYTDPERVRFDFAVHVRKDGDYGDRIVEKGGHIFTLDRLTRHPVKSLSNLKRLVRDGKYDVVVRHAPNALVAPQLLVAKRGGALTVCHSHSADDPQKLPHYLGRLIMNRVSDGKVACSPEAGRWMFGKADFAVVKNAIDIKKFRYDREAERRIRDEFGLWGKTVYGHIGNFVYAKNHPYLIDIFKEILARDENAVCILVGEGALRGEIEKRIDAAGIRDRVILTGIRNDAPDFTSAFDVLLFPSVYEGIPLTLIEAQAASLPGIISDRISEEVIITKGLLIRESIEEEPSVWGKRAIGMAKKQAEYPEDAESNDGPSRNDSGESDRKEKQRIQQTSAIRDAGYDAEAAARWYMDYFEALVNGK